MVRIKRLFLAATLITAIMANAGRAAVTAQWKMNDNAATTAVDETNGSHDGVFTDPTGIDTTDAHDVTGVVSGALDFDGTDDYVDVADHGDFTFALAPMSISAWVYMHEATNFDIISKAEGGKEEWAFSLDASDMLTFEIWDQSEGSYIGRYYQHALTGFQDSWTHVVATYDGGTSCSSCKLYLETARVDNQDFTSASTWTSSEDLASKVWIGRRLTDYADGYIDNVIIYDVELTQSQVDDLYNNGLGYEGAEPSSGVACNMRDRYPNGHRDTYRKRYKYE